MYVTPPRIGTRAQQLSDATSSEEIDAIVSLISAQFEKKVGRKQKKPEYSAYLEHFLNASPDHRNALIRNFKLLSGDADPIDPLRSLLYLTVDPSVIDLLCMSAVGLAKEQADALIRNSKPAIIDAAKFRRQFRTFVQRNNLPGLLTSFSNPPTASETKSLLSRRPTFIRQLELIEIDADERLRAVSDYLRTSADKVMWADAGLVFERDLRDWDDDLVSRHGHIRGEVWDAHADKEARTRGRLVYHRCGTMHAPLGGRAVPGHFVPGCLQALSDILSIGWHPDYERLLSDATHEPE